MFFIIVFFPFSNERRFDAMAVAVARNSFSKQINSILWELSFKAEMMKMKKKQREQISTCYKSKNDLTKYFCTLQSHSWSTNYKEKPVDGSFLSPRLDSLLSWFFFSSFLFRTLEIVPISIKPFLEHTQSIASLTFRLRCNGWSQCSGARHEKG